MLKVLERPSIILKQISVNYMDTIGDYAADDYANDIGRYPYLQIRNLVIQTTDTIKIVLYNDQFLPKIEVYFKDPTMKLIDPLFPLDDDIISLFIRSSSELLMPIRMDFKITEFNVVKNDENINYVLTGLLDVNYLYFQLYSTYNSTSFDLLKRMASEAKLGFASNIENTNDLMTWINPADTNMEFIQHVVKHSYRSDESFMLSYIDFYYNLNYVDIETALNEDITGMEGIYWGANFTKVKDETVTPLFLTDHPDKINSSMYIQKYNLLNSTMKINLDIGYQKYLTYYDKNGNTEYQFLMDTISTPGANNKNVILKGKIGKNSEIANNSWDGDFMGVIDSDNVHKNYLYAEMQNNQNLEFLQKVKIKITLGMMNFNLYRFQKIELRFYKLQEMSDKKVIANINPDTLAKDATKDYDIDRLNQRLSGEWLITAINYTFNKIGGFSQEVTLVRRELGFNENDYNVE
jgi:hypothetical protein